MGNINLSMGNIEVLVDGIEVLLDISMDRINTLLGNINL